MRGPRITLRPPRRSDSAAIYAYASDRRSSQYLGWAPHAHEAETQAFIQECEAAWAGGKRLRWLIEGEDAQVIGMIEVQLSRSLSGIGYVIAPDAWGYGYATEAVQVVIDGLFAHTRVASIWAVCDVENAASARVLKKCGFSRHNTLPAYRKCPNISDQMRDFISYVRERV